ncbi:MAG: AMP-dependent synthetase [Alphaproteobacteria bacterium]|nr:AMP-dependent synthetase [Alphaproteobacteria bacterium]
MLDPAESYETACRNFHWRVPPRYNIGVDIVDRHEPSKPALIYEDAVGTVMRYSFGDIAKLSNRLANAFIAHGLTRGDRVGILLPQRPETALAHVACYKAGLIAVPLFTLFGADALEYRLGNSGARALIADEASLAKIVEIRPRLPKLDLVLAADRKRDGADALAFWPTLERSADHFQAVDTSADDPAIIIYTSGTTGPPKGALHAHRVLLGHLPGVEFPQEFFPQSGDLFWTPADWAWIGGLIDVLLPSWHHGVPVLAHRARKFDPDHAFHLMAKHGVRNAFLPPTALKLMRQVDDPVARHRFKLRSIGSGGESLGAELIEWSRRVFGFTINEFYGQTECNLVVGNCASIMPVRPGAMGRSIPGHCVAIVDGEGREVPDGTVGHIAIRHPDPVMFLEYWRNPEATRAKFVADWLMTGDLGRRDDQGYFWYFGRSDDVITSAGYRIGPAEIEECLLRHPSVAFAAAVGIPDPVRTEIVKAFLVLKPGHDGNDALRADIQTFIKSRLAAHEYPRAIEFLDSLPMTATGKIMRRELRQRQADGIEKP